MADEQPERYAREGTPLGRTADDVAFGPSYSTETPHRRRLWWRIRDLLRWPMKNSSRR
ncbi:hypothetical protein [Streptomyces sp. NBC_01465]|uniref:hypothetical protein n=1 Tax=Streptomyces sp. NBC_01465 TaxID=2903878 RepID=UPI002E2F5CCE|nr:hypothetical protein [Streptomyces sp. NBC_01465]